MTDLLTPDAQGDAHYWASVLLAHALIGAVLVAVLAWALARWVASLLPWPSALQIVSGGYVVGWEGAAQRLGAGWLDAAVDSAAVTLGGLLAWGLWAHRLRLIRGGAGVLAVILAVGVWRRRGKSGGKDA